jgi:Tfp pilus assembly protein FimT
VSLPELLVVIAVLALVIMASVPLVASRVQRFRARSAAGQFVVVLRAARMIAVTRTSEISVSVMPDPANAYAHVDSEGRVHQVQLPPGVRIAASSTGTITFKPDGTLEQPATTVFETTFVEDMVERWTVETAVTGITRLTRELEEHP